MGSWTNGLKCACVFYHQNLPANSYPLRLPLAYGGHTGYIVFFGKEEPREDFHAGSGSWLGSFGQDIPRFMLPKSIVQERISHK
jgi:hypothetical protein